MDIKLQYRIQDGWKLGRKNRILFTAITKVIPIVKIEYTLFA